LIDVVFISLLFRVLVCLLVVGWCLFKYHGVCVISFVC